MVARGAFAADPGPLEPSESRPPFEATLARFVDAANAQLAAWIAAGEMPPYKTARVYELKEHSRARLALLVVERRPTCYEHDYGFAFVERATGNIISVANKLARTTTARERACPRGNIYALDHGVHAITPEGTVSVQSRQCQDCGTLCHGFWRLGVWRARCPACARAPARADDARPPRLPSPVRAPPPPAPQPAGAPPASSPTGAAGAPPASSPTGAAAAAGASA
jgi:hypothetical protein